MWWAVASPRRLRAQRGRWLLLACATAIAIPGMYVRQLGVNLESALGDTAHNLRPNWFPQLEEHSRTAAIQARVDGRVLITGGGGNIGKHLIRRLLAANVPVTSIDVVFVDEELDSTYREVPEAHALLRVMSGDIRDQQLLQSALTPDTVGVINLAAVSNARWCLDNQPDCEDVNVRGVASLLTAMTRSGVDPWFIQASSWEVYGSATSLPITEDSPRSAESVYGASKARAEEVIERKVGDHLAAWSARSLRAIVLRLSDVYGGEFDHQEHLIPSMMTQAMAHRPVQVSSDYQALDLIHIDDATDSFILAANRLERHRRHSRTFWGFFSRGASDLEVYNVASGVTVPVPELLRKILSVTQSSSPVQTIPGNDMPDQYVGHTEKASSMLGFTKRINLDEGLHQLATVSTRRTIDYLDGRIKETCPVLSKYTANDLLKLDGCSGIVATYGPDLNGYLRMWDDPPQFGWWDAIDPPIWSFLMTDRSSQDPVFQFMLGAEPFEALEEGQSRGEGESHFRLSIDPATGHVRLRSAWTDRAILGEQQLFRLTPICCPNQEGPWPFFREDPLASAIFDLRTERSHDMSASRIRSLCSRLESARQTAQERLDHLASFAQPVKVEQAPTPTGSSADWRMRNLPACTNLCDHPTICVDTGSCMCVQSSCPTLSRNPFALSAAHPPGLSYPPPIIDEEHLLDPDVLKDQVRRSNWLNILRPHAAQYLARSPPFMRINLTRLPDEAQAHRDDNAESYDELHNNRWGCYSADSTMERGVKQISTEYSDDGLVFLPYYEGTVVSDGFMQLPHETIDNWFDHTRHNLPPSFDEANLVIPFVHDWGPCNFWYLTVYESREHAGVTRAIQKGSAWAAMGDLNVNCYRPDQDVVIPPRTCQQDHLRERFGDIQRVRPLRQRTILAAFKGSLQGQGTTFRQRVCCPRSYHRFTESRLEGGSAMPTYWDTYPEGKDYLQTLGDTVFCPLPPGVTGWATRTVDVIYSGCIPVLIGDATHHPFWDLLDWSKFSIHISEGDIDQLEQVLLRYSWTQLQQLQTNLMLVRDAFLYPTDGHMDQLLQTRGPFFFAMHATALLRRSKYPV